MRRAKQDLHRQPPPADPSIDLPIAAAPTPGPDTSATDERASFEQRPRFGSVSGIELQYPERLVWPSPWVGHIPFAFWLVEALKPRVVVELGVHSGNSYCAFLQAIRSLALAAQCYGIDHWRGDEHSDRYDDDVYAELRGYHDQRYGSFSTLIRATFEESLPYFSDGSIDLLHIDGFHTYDAVVKDYSDWLPKMSARGVVLFHDINVREREFGVWRLWDELTARYPTLAFAHSHGLGVAYVGTAPPPAALRALLAAFSEPDSLERIRAYFSRLGMSVVDRFERHRAEGAADRARASEAGLEAARAEIRSQLETSEAWRTKAADTAARVAMLEGELAASGHEDARRIQSIERLQQELSAARTETAREAEAACALQQQLADATAELARHSDDARIGKVDAQRAADRVAFLEGELETARADIARQLEDADAARATVAERTGQVAVLDEQLSRARAHTAEAIAQRERATQMLRQQITVTGRLQRELSAVAEAMDELTAQHTVLAAGAANLDSANREIREQLTQAEQELHRVHGAVAATLAQPRYVLADRLNGWMKNARFVHASLKRVWTGRHRDRS